MKALQIAAVTLLTIAATSCASLQGTTSADSNGDGVVSKKELIQHQRRLNSGQAQQGYELGSLRHVESMIGTTKDIIESLRHF